MQGIIGLPMRKLLFSTAGKMRVGPQTLARPLSSMPPAFVKLGYLDSTRNEKNVSNMRPLSTGKSQQPLGLRKIFHNCVLHPVRTYAKVTKLKYDCWFCEEETAKKNAVLCQRCGNIQDVESRIDFYALLDMPQAFFLDEQTLWKNVCQLKNILRPYSVGQRKREEKRFAAAWGQMLDIAYDTLADPYKRAEYMLNMYGYSVPEFASGRKLIVEVIEKNIEIEEAETTEQLQKISDGVIMHLGECFGKLHEQLDNMKLDAACKTLEHMRYYRTILSNIADKKETLAKQA